MKSAIGSHDLLFITLDSLRYDVAQLAHQQQETPAISQYLPAEGWECRHSPGTFTFPAHMSFFSGFLPTPTTPGTHSRLFAASFAGSTTTSKETFVFEEPDLPTALKSRGYKTWCIGGVGFFNNQPPMGNILTAPFDLAFWHPSTGVKSRLSTERQVDKAITLLEAEERDQSVFLFMNISATHTPTHIFAEGTQKDSPDTQRAALRYVDSHLARLFNTMQKRRPVFVILCADHGEAFGEDGFHGHRIAHPTVWNVPYAQFILQETPC